MTLTEEQAKYIKEQILKQIESLPEDKRESLKQYILSLNNEQLEDFLEKNKMLQEKDSQDEKGYSKEEPKADKKKQEKECIFCLISSKQIEAFSIYEDKDYLAALEINPLSQGHLILIPKEHIKEVRQLPSKAFTIASKIGKHLIKQLAAENYQITTSDELKHAIINIIPSYKDIPLDSKRKPAKKQELQELAMKIGIIKNKEKSISIKKQDKKDKKSPEINERKSNIIQMNRRIP